MKADPISEFLQQRIDAGDFPSAVYLVAEKGEVIFRDARGHAVAEPEKIEASVDTIYDLASLTKPLITGLLAAMLVDRGEIDLGAAVGNILPEFYVSSNAEITVDRLVLHTSGLPAWRPFYLLVETRDQVLDEIARTMLPENQDPVTYSDLNFITLAGIVEQIAGTDLAQVAAAEIFEPLRLQKTVFNPLSKFERQLVAASEKGNRYESQTCVEMGYLEEGQSSKFLRDHQIWGEVHDGNAWFMGGVAGHAGLFSTVEEVFQIAQQFLPGYTKLLTPETTELFRTNYTKSLNEHRSFAFQLASSEGSTAGTSMPSEAFGHNGFTGTSLWIDPVNERVFVLLTNRTHAHPLPFVNINSVRRRFHDLAIDLLDAKI